MESQSVGASFNKFGFPECSNSTPPKLFLTQTTDTVGIFTVSGSDDVNLNFNTETISTYGISGSYTVSCSGAGHVDGIGDTTYDCDGWAAADGLDSDGWNSILCGGCDDFDYWPYDIISQICNSTTTSTSSLYVVNDPDDDLYWYSTFTVTDTLSSEFTDSMLLGLVSSHMPSFSDSTPWDGGSGQAFITFDDRHQYATGGKMQYRLKVPDSDKGASYKIEWLEWTVTTVGTNTTTTSNRKGETITGTGDPVNPAYSSIHMVDMPQTPNTTIYEGVPSLSKVTDMPNAGDGGAD